MTSPRKFAEKIALLQQKQAESDAAFNTILYEVEAAKQKTDRVSSTKHKLDVPTRKYEMSNGMNNSDNANQSIKIENNNGFDRLLLPPDNSLWRRTHSDSALHESMMPTVIAHYHAQHNNDDNNQQLNYEINDVKLEPPSYSIPLQHHHLQVSNSSFQPPQQHHQYDLNNNNFTNDRTNVCYLPMPQQNIGASTTNPNTHTIRYGYGNHNSNVLMLPPNHQSRGGGSLPDLRLGSVYNTNNQQLSYSTVPSPPTSLSQHSFRSLSPQQNGNGDLFMLEPQQQSSSRIGPLKQSSSMRRRHSPIGDVKQSSSRRHNSSSPDVSSTQQSVYRVEPQSPQSQSSYSPQNSPHLLSSPGNEFAPFSPQQQSTDNQQHYFTLPNQFDQITLDNNFYTQQQQQPPSPQPNHNHSLPATPGGTNNLQQRNYYASFIDDMPLSYGHNQTTNVNLKSPTIPNIILTDVDSSKLDLSKELANDFSNPFDSLIDATDLQFNTEDFLLNTVDLSMDPTICDEPFRMER